MEESNQADDVAGRIRAFITDELLFEDMPLRAHRAWRVLARTARGGGHEEP